MVNARKCISSRLDGDVIAEMGEESVRSVGQCKEKDEVSQTIILEYFDQGRIDHDACSLRVPQLACELNVADKRFT